MHPVQGGFETHRIRGDGDYEAKKRAALAQSKQNEYIQGVQQGVGRMIANTRTKYGNVNIMPQEVLEGSTNNFRAQESAGNKVLNDPVNQTGSQPLQTSATQITQQDPQVFETDALDRRLAMMAKGGMNNLNDISNLYPRS